MEKLNNLTTKESIASQLRELIFSGQLSDGEEITQNEVADSLALSRMPVREAFQLLTEEGLLTRLSNRHISVNGMSFKRASAFFKHLISSDCIALDYMKTVEMEYADEFSWHRRLLSSSNDSLIASIGLSSLKGYPEYFFSRSASSERFSMLSELDVLISEGKMEDVKQILRTDYLSAIISALEVEFALKSETD